MELWFVLDYSFIKEVITVRIYMNEDSLPPNFAEKVLELESQLDDSHSMVLITELNELYRVFS